MNLNFHNLDLRGRSFKRQNLKGADFSYTNIQGVNFSNSILEKANFSHAKAGLTLFSLTRLLLFFIVIALCSGVITGYASAFPVLTFSVFYNEEIWVTKLFSFVGFLVFNLFIIIIIRQGIGKILALLAIFFVILAAILAYIPIGVGADVLLQALVVTAIIASILFGSLVQAIFLSLTQKNKAIILFITPSLFGTILGVIEGIQGISSKFIFLSLLMAGIFSIFFLFIMVYVAIRAVAGDKKYSLVKAISTNICTSLGTNFRRTNLTDADFTGAILSNTDFRKASLKRTCWFQVKELALARVEDTYLQNTQLRQLLITGQGQDKNFDGQDLHGVNLQNAILTDTSFIGAYLSEANLQDADLSRAKLVQTQLNSTDFTGAIITGAYIQDWGITSDTKFNGVRCEYVYMRLPTKEKPHPPRKPDNHKEVFADGDFGDFIKPIVDTLDLYHNQNVDPRAIAISFKQLAENNPDDELEIVAMEKRGQDKFLLRAKTAPDANKSELSNEYFNTYNQVKELPEREIQLLLAEKDSQIRRLENMVMTALECPSFYAQNYHNQGDTKVSEFYQSKYDQRNANNQFVDTAESGSNVSFTQNNNYTPEQKQSLAEAAAEIQKLLYQLAQNNQTNDEQVTKIIHDEIKNNPTLKARLQSALKAGGLEALKAIFNHPLFNIPAETIKGFIEAE